MHIICSGNTKPFSGQLAELGYASKTRDTDTPYKEYFRVLENVNLADLPAALETFYGYLLLR